MFCYISHIVEDRFFDEIEMFFLVVGHTHNILDQWFSVLAKAIRNAHFIGSVLAIQELYKIAHTDKNEHLRPALVHQLRTYHDWRRLYAPVYNEEIHHYGIPLRFKLTLDEQLGVATMRYMPFSPPYGLKTHEVWHPKPTELGVRNTRMDGDIVLTPLIVFNGPEEVLAALGSDSGTTQTDLAVGSQKQRDAASDINHVMPILREIEVRAIGESAIRMDQEAEAGSSEEHVTVSASTLKRIDALVNAGNSKKDGTGRIVWLKRSKLAYDPTWLDRAPDVLPNPCLWEERIRNAPIAPVEADLDRSTEAAPASSEASTGDHDQATSSAATTSQRRRPRSTETPEEAALRKKLAADASESQTRLLAFQKAAADIAITSGHMIKLIEKSGAIELSPLTSISDATNEFNKAVLTTREFQWYKAHESGAKITAAVKVLVAAEEAKPWKLLDLPTITEEQKQRIAETERLRAETAARIEANLRGLLMRPGEGEYDPTLQVMSFEGFAPAESKDVAKMKRAALEGIAKTFMKIAPGEIRKLNVDQLREKVKAYVELHPDVVHFPTPAAMLAAQAASANGSAGPGPVTTEELTQVGSHGDSREDTASASGGTLVASEPESCCVIECEGPIGRPMVKCPECTRVFCEELHGAHGSHSLQMLKPLNDRLPVAATVMTVTAAPQSSATSASTPSRHGRGNKRQRVTFASESDSEPQPLAPTAVVPPRQAAQAESSGSASSQASSKKAKTTTSKLKQQAREVLAAAAKASESSESASATPNPLPTEPAGDANIVPVALPALPAATTAVPEHVPIRRLGQDGDNPLVRQNLDADKLACAVESIRELQRLGQANRDTLYKKFNFPSYDTAFLCDLSKAFNVDVSPVLQRKRASAKDVLEYFISALF